MIGKSVSHYQILEKLGAGGMGVVWKARDVRLNRIVALKMLHPGSYDNPERRQRFLHEAQAASALSHPHIVTVHDIVVHDGADFIVMEHISGKALDAIIPRKGMRLVEALRIAVQVADALSAAHRAGIVHRDLKPGNVMVSETGAAKVLDFGLAKAEEQKPGGEDAVTRTVAPKTMDGVAVGTVGYMSPEQAEAKPVDARSDIFSFGALLYEMVTGDRAFTGDTNLSTLAAVLHKEPAAMSLSIPAELQRVIARCLRKDPRRRFQHMDDFMIALEELRDESESSTPAVSATARATNQSSRKWIAIGAAVAVLIAAAVWWLTGGGVMETPLAATEAPLTSNPGIQHSPSFSPDGNQVAFSWNGEKQDNYDIYIKLIGSPASLRLTSDAAEDIAPAFSPDGRAIAFIREGKARNLLITIPPLGGPERVVAELPASVHHFSYLPDGKAVIVSGLAVVSMDSGDIKPLNTAPQKATDWMPAVEPNGRAVAFARGSGSGGDIYVAGLDGAGNLTGTPRRLTTTAHSVMGIAWTVDSATLVVSSGPAAAPSGLWRIGVVSPGPPEALPFGRGGDSVSVARSGEGSSVAIARIGNRLAYGRAVVNVNLWRLPLATPATPGGTPVKFLPSTRLEINPAYSPDGKRVVFHSTRSGKPGLWAGEASGANAAELFVPERGHAGSPSWSPDGQTVAFDWNETGRYQIYTVRAAGGKPNRLTNNSAGDTIPSWSGDGKWIYFTSTLSGRQEIWKIPASGGDAAQVTRNGGLLPKESPDGRFVYYLKNGGDGGIWRTPVSGSWEESQIIPSIYRRHLALSAQGIYFVSAAGEDGKHTLYYVSFEGGKPKAILTLPRIPVMGLAVSRDGGSLLYSQNEHSSQELALVENFR